MHIDLSSVQNRTASLRNGKKLNLQLIRRQIFFLGSINYLFLRPRISILTKKVPLMYKGASRYFSSLGRRDSRHLSQLTEMILRRPRPHRFNKHLQFSRLRPNFCSSSILSSQNGLFGFSIIKRTWIGWRGCQKSAQFLLWKNSGR